MKNNNSLTFIIVSVFVLSGNCIFAAREERKNISFVDKLLHPDSVLYSWIKEKKLVLNFIISGIGGVNYSIKYEWIGKYILSGWGYNYGVEGDVYIVYRPYKVGLGMTYGSIYEVMILKPSWYEYDIWFTQGYKIRIIYKILLYATESFNFWLGSGTDNFKIIYSENKWLDRGIWHRIEFDRLKGKEEVFQIFCIGLNIKWKNIIFSFKFVFGTNETDVMSEKGAIENFQILLGIGGKFL
jgi:hypothetical protein